MSQWLVHKYYICTYIFRFLHYVVVKIITVLLCYADCHTIVLSDQLQFDSYIMTDKVKNSLNNCAHAAENSIL